MSGSTADLKADAINALTRSLQTKIQQYSDMKEDAGNSPEAYVALQELHRRFTIDVDMARDSLLVAREQNSKDNLASVTKAIAALAEVIRGWDVNYKLLAPNIKDSTGWFGAFADARRNEMAAYIVEIENRGGKTPEKLSVALQGKVEALRLLKKEKLSRFSGAEAQLRAALADPQKTPDVAGEKIDQAVWAWMIRNKSADALKSAKEATETFGKALSSAATAAVNKAKSAIFGSPKETVKSQGPEQLKAKEIANLIPKDPMDGLKKPELRVPPEPPSARSATGLKVNFAPVVKNSQDEVDSMLKAPIITANNPEYVTKKGKIGPEKQPPRKPLKPNAANKGTSVLDLMASLEREKQDAAALKKAKDSTFNAHPGLKKVEAKLAPKLNEQKDKVPRGPSKQ